MVKTKNGVSKLVALVLILTLAVASLLLALSTNRKSVYAATASVDSIILYQKDTLFVSGSVIDEKKNLYDGKKLIIKSQTELIKAGDISITNGQLTILNKNLEGDLEVTLTNNSLDSLFEGCTKLNAIKLTTSGVDVWNKTFYGCSGLKKALITVSGVSSTFSSSTKVFNGCSELKYFMVNNSQVGSGDTSATFENLGLEYNNIYCYSEDRSAEKSAKVKLKCVYIYSEYAGIEETPSTGFETSLMGFGVTAIILVAICYILVKKKKFQN